MMGSNRDHDFDWIDAYLACSVDREFVEVKRAAEACVEKYDSVYRTKHPQAGVSFGFKQEDQRSFLVTRDMPHNETAIRFTQCDDHILVERTRERETARLTLVLNDDGDCRYQINGRGEFLRWQVLKSVLQGLLLMGSVKKRRLVW